MQPAGVLVLTVHARKTGTFQADIAMPYGQIDGQYRLLAGRYSANKLVELRARSNAQLLDALFAQGIRETLPAHEKRIDWKTAATVLPPGGGELGAAYELEVARDYLHYSTGDIAAVLAEGGDGLQGLYSDGNSTPVAERFRILELRTEAVRMPKSINVLGGYRLGDIVVLDTIGQAENQFVASWSRRMTPLRLPNVLQNSSNKDLSSRKNRRAC